MFYFWTINFLRLIKFFFCSVLYKIIEFEIGDSSISKGYNYCKCLAFLQSRRDEIIIEEVLINTEP